jgi:hypothetical protein
MAQEDTVLKDITMSLLQVLMAISLQALEKLMIVLEI